MAKKPKDDSIKLHPKYGLNPTMSICNWCQKPTGEIALLGRAYKGEAPRQMVVDDTPCKACQAEMAKGITFIEFHSKTDERRTGRWAVVNEESVREALNEEVFASAQKSRFVKITPENSQALGLFDDPDLNLDKEKSE